MEAGLVNRFIQSAQEVLQAEVGGPAKMGRISVQSVPYTSQHITVLVGIAGTLRGVMLLGLSEDTAKRLVSNMMGEEVQELDEMAQSGVAEMGNVIAGSAITGLYDDGHVCKIATPTLIIGSGTTILTGTNTYDGDTSVSAGTLQAGAANTFSSSSAFTVSSGE